MPNFRVPRVLPSLAQVDPSALLEEVFGLIEEARRGARRLSFDLCPPVLYELGLASPVDLTKYAIREGLTTV